MAPSPALGLRHDKMEKAPPEVRPFETSDLAAAAHQVLGPKNP